MAIQLELSEQEAEIVGVVLDWWLEGLPEAKDRTIGDDRTLQTLDQLMDACSGLDDQERLLKQVKEKLSVR